MSGRKAAEEAFVAEGSMGFGRGPLPTFTDAAEAFLAALAPTTAGAKAWLELHKKVGGGCLRTRPAPLDTAAGSAPAHSVVH